MSASLVVSLAVTLAVVCGGAAWFIGPWRHERRDALGFLLVALVAPLIGFLVGHGGDFPEAVAVSYLTGLVPVGVGLLIALAWKRRSTR